MARPASGVANCRPLPRAFFDRPASVVAPELLGKLFVVDHPRGSLAGRIVEVEAYEAHEPASHSHRGPTPRNAVMFGPPGHLYVYFSYGVHWCANVVCGAVGDGAAVLLRALEPVSGVEAMATNRPKARKATDYCSGPGKLCAALGITGANNGADLTVAGGTVWLGIDAVRAPEGDEVAHGPRIGISKAMELPWRWWLRGNPHVSRPRFPS